MILFRIFHFFGSEESVWSEITNPFLGSLRKTHPYCWFYSLDSKRVLTFPSRLFLDSPQISVSFNVQDAGRVLVPKIVLSFAQQNTPPLQANWQHVTKTTSYGAWNRAWRSGTKVGQLFIFFFINTFYISYTCVECGKDVPSLGIYNFSKTLF